jgi:ABC-2 type transport system permease protein/oleandomycin transport system permease protein
MRRRLDLGATLIGEPSLLLLDEPTAGLDPRSRHDLWDLIEQIARRGTSVLVTSQHLDEIDRLADRVVVLGDGVVLADDTPGALVERVGGRTLEDVFFALTGAPPTIEPVEDDPPVRAASLGAGTRPVVTRSTWRDIAVVTGRCWKHLVRTPQSLFFALVQPVLFVIGLQAVFGDLVEQVVGDDYIQFLLPGVVVMNLALMAGQTGVGLTTDLREGIVDRFRSLPMAHVAVLAGRTTTDLLRSALSVSVMVLAGWAIGFRLHGGVGHGVAALGVALLFGYAVMWVFTSIGLAVKDPQAAAFLGFAPMLLFVYLSSAWVPIETMSGAIQGFARHQPVNVTIQAVRALTAGEPAGGDVARSLAWSIGLVAVFATVSTRQLRRATA